MAELCKDCFIEKAMNGSEYRAYEDGRLSIVMTNYDDLCESCGVVGPVVDCMIYEQGI